VLGAGEPREAAPTMSTVVSAMGHRLPLDASPARAGTAVEIVQSSMSGPHHPLWVMPQVGASARLGVS
jgi:hypothetical protein